MLTLILLLALQKDIPPNYLDAPHDSIKLDGPGGKVIDDLKQPVRVHLVLKDELTKNVIAKTDSFANGTFNFYLPYDLYRTDHGPFYISVIDPRYLIKDIHLDRDYDGTIVLTRNGGVPASPSNNGAGAFIEELNNLNMNALSASTNPAAFEEFSKAVDLARLESRTNNVPPTTNGSSAADTAEMHFKKAVTLAPDFYEGKFQLGLEQIRHGHMDDATATLEHAASMNTSDPRPLRVLSELYLQQKQFQKSVDTLVQAGTLGTLNADDRFRLGVAFENLDNTAAAQQQFLSAISLAPGKNPQAYLHLNNMDIELNQLAAGITILEDFQRLFPNDPNHKTAEDRLKKLREALKKQQKGSF